LNPTLNPTLTNSAQNLGFFHFFGGGGKARFKVGLGLGSFVGVFWSSNLKSYLEFYLNIS
jgi:hypothetical protein